MKCSYCGSVLHTLNNCPKTAAGQCNRLYMRCSYCGSKQHNVEACPKTYTGNAKRVWHPEDVKDHFILDG